MTRRLPGPWGTRRTRVPVGRVLGGRSAGKGAGRAAALYPLLVQFLQLSPAPREGSPLALLPPVSAPLLLPHSFLFSLLCDLFLICT